MQIYIELIDSEPLVWRRLRLPPQVLAPQLHQILQAVMGWSGQPDYRFAPSFQAPLGAVLTAEVTLLYTYDLQDGWLHRLRWEAASDGPLTCLAGAGACPPEGSGGVWGYDQLLERLEDPGDPDYIDLWDWVGGDFSPDAFDLAAVNQRLARLDVHP